MGFNIPGSLIINVTNCIVSGMLGLTTLKIFAKV